MGGWGGGGVEKWRLKLTSAKVEVEVEAELGNRTVPSKKTKYSKSRDIVQIGGREVNPIPKK